jgi:hypothetical protein
VFGHPWQGSGSCPEGQAYSRDLPNRFAKEAANRVELTGWARNEVEAQMENAGQPMKGAFSLDAVLSGKWRH